jgi:hypothetical protein
MRKQRAKLCAFNDKQYKPKRLTRILPGSSG